MNKTVSSAMLLQYCYVKSLCYVHEINENQKYILTYLKRQEYADDCNICCFLWGLFLNWGLPFETMW